MKAKHNIRPAEIVWYSIAGALVIWGLIEIILGLIARLTPVIDSKNQLLALEKAYRATFGLGFLEWGLILFGIGILLGILVLCIYASKFDRESEKSTRRAARLARANKTTEPSVVEAEVKDVPAE